MSVNYILGSRYLLNDDIDITSRECRTRCRILSFPVKKHPSEDRGEPLDLLNTTEITTFGSING